MKPAFPPSSYIVFDDKSIATPVFLMSLIRRKFKVDDAVRFNVAETPGVVERAVIRASALLPSSVNSPDTLSVLPDVKYSVSRTEEVICLKKLITLFAPFSV